MRKCLLTHCPQLMLYARLQWLAIGGRSQNRFRILGSASHLPLPVRRIGQKGPRPGLIRQPGRRSCHFARYAAIGPFIFAWFSIKGDDLIAAASFPLH